MANRHDTNTATGPEDPDWLAGAGPQLQQVYAYWRGKCRDGKAPRRADIDPIDIPRLLSHLMIVDVVADAQRPNGRNYVYRLVGTKEVEIRGFDPTGKSVAEGFFGFSAEDALGFYDRTVDTMRPQYDATPCLSTNGRWINDETVFLPLSDDGKTVNRVLVFAAIAPSRPGGRPAPVSARKP